MSKRNENAMPKWELMRLEIAGGERRLRPLTEEERVWEPYYTMLLTRAVEAQCGSPIFSDYHVKGCIAVGELVVAQSENIEYGHYQALHLEEAAVAALASRQNSIANPTPPVLAIVAGHGPGTLDTLTMPCGNCRRFLQDTVGKSCVILCGTLDGGTGMVATLADALFENYTRVPLGQIDVLDIAITQTIREGTRLTHNHYYDSTKCPSRNYAVALTTGRGTVSDRTYFGATSNKGAFHPIYPMEDAVRAAERADDPYVRSVIVVAEGDGSVPPDVDYRDRQCLLEFAIDRELLTGKRYDLPVRLFTHTNGKLTGAWKTSAEEWLPLPFSPKNFGAEFIADYAAYLKKKYNASR